MSERGPTPRRRRRAPLRRPVEVEEVGDGTTETNKALEKEFFNDLRERRRNKGGDSDPMLDPSHPRFSGPKRMKVVTAGGRIIHKEDRTEEILERARREREDARAQRGAGMLLDDDVDSSDDDDADRQASNELDVNRQHEENIASLKWQYPFVRFDQLNALSPFAAFRYYFVRHTTGPSLAYMVFSAIFISMFCLIMIRRYTDDPKQEISLRQPLLSGPESTLPRMGFAFEASSSPSDVQIEYRLRYDERDRNDATRLTTQSTSTLTTNFTCQIGTYSSLNCIDNVNLRGAPFQREHRWLQVRVFGPASAFMGGQLRFVTETYDDQLIIFSVNVAEPQKTIVTRAFPYRAGMSQRTVFTLMHNDVIERGRYMVNSDIEVFPAFDASAPATTSHFATPSGSTLQYDVRFELAQRMNKVDIRPLSFVNLMS